MVTILVVGAIQSAFFAILVLTKKKKDLADYMLALIFLFLFYEFFVNLVSITEWLFRFPHLLGTAAPLTLLLGPLLFFYIKIHISERPIFKKKYYLHFLPYLIDSLSYLNFYTQSGSKKIEDFFELVNGKPEGFLALTLLAHSISPLIYTIWSVLTVREHREKIKHLYSYTNTKMTLDWLWYLTWSMMVVSICSLILNSIIVFFDVADWVQLRFIILTIAVIWVFTLGYYGVRRTSFFSAFPLQSNGATAGKDATVKYEKNRLKASLIPEYKNKLKRHMDESKPYLNSKLTIHQLAGNLGIPVHHLSQILNEEIGQNFFEFINSYRVSEVQQRFLDPEYKNLTLLGIALESGFNSKASFNRIFKQMTNQTPTEFIRTQKTQ